MKELVVERDVYTQATPAWLTIKVTASEKEIFKYYDGVFPIIKAGNKLYKGTDKEVYRRIMKIAEEIADIACEHGLTINKWNDNIHGSQKWLVKNPQAIKQIMQLISKAEEILASVA